MRRSALRLASMLARRGITVRFDERLARELGRPGHAVAPLASWCGMLVTLGGDGTALRGARALARKRGVLLPVNLGGLGFLSAAEARELAIAMRAALAGKWPIARVRLLEARVTRRGRAVRRALAMNDVVLKAAGGYSAVHLRLEALGADLGHLLADGVIAASAAGSTAYSLSTGGPVVARELDVLIVTPVCPHSLGSRSLVLGAGDELQIRVLGSADQPTLYFDGQNPVPLEPRDEIRVRLSRATVRRFENPARPLAHTLRAKLGWQGSGRRSPT